MVFANSDVYEGDWVYDRRCGWGIYTSYFENWVYTGHWLDDMKHGSGSYSCPNVVDYVGDWRYDLKHGHGVLKMDGFVYTGAFCSGVRSGFGIQTYPDGSKYEGDWKEDTRFGTGIFVTNINLTLGTFEIYRGEWKLDKMHGSGKYAWCDGSYFDGIWEEDNIKSGFYQFADGTSYKGDFVDDLFHGVGVYTNGKNIYDGMWKNGKRHGLGKQWNSNGSRHEGMYVEDMKHGQGVHYFADFKMWKGKWENDNRVGKGVYEYPPAYWELASYKRKILEAESRFAAKELWKVVEPDALKRAALFFHIRAHQAYTRKVKTEAMAKNLVNAVITECEGLILSRASEKARQEQDEHRKVQAAKLNASLLSGLMGNSSPEANGVVKGYQSDESSEYIPFVDDSLPVVVRPSSRLKKQHVTDSDEGDDEVDEGDEEEVDGSVDQDEVTEDPFVCPQYANLIEPPDTDENIDRKDFVESQYGKDGKSDGGDDGHDENNVEDPFVCPQYATLSESPDSDENIDRKDFVESQYDKDDKNDRGGDDGHDKNNEQKESNPFVELQYDENRNDVSKK